MKAADYRLAFIAQTLDKIECPQNDIPRTFLRAEKRSQRMLEKIEIPASNENPRRILSETLDQTRRIGRMADWDMAG